MYGVILSREVTQPGLREHPNLYLYSPGYHPSSALGFARPSLARGLEEVAPSNKDFITAK